MTIIDRVDDALLAIAGRAAGAMRDLAGVGQWPLARGLARLFIVLGIAAQYAMMLERGFAAGNMLILGVWMWHYATTLRSIDRYAGMSDGSSRARVLEHPQRSAYPFIYALLYGIVVSVGVRPSGALMLVAWAAMIAAHYVTACEPPPPGRNSSRSPLLAF